jgi:ParB/RepB/Spo0J family partition protein
MAMTDQEFQEKVTDELWQPDRHRRAVTGEEGLWMVDVEYIRHGRYGHTDYSPAELQDLVSSIEKHKVLTPLLLRYDPLARDHNLYIIICGGRRLEASKLAGLTEVPALIRSDCNDTQAYTLNLVDNLHHRQMTPLETATYISELKDLLSTPTKKCSTNDLAARLGFSNSVVRGWLEAAGVAADVKELLEFEGTKSLAPLINKVSPHLRIAPEPGQPKIQFRKYLIEEAKHGATFQDVKHVIEEHSPKPKQAKVPQLVMLPPSVPQDATEQEGRPFDRSRAFCDHLRTAAAALSAGRDLLDGGDVDTAEAWEVVTQAEEVLRQIRERLESRQDEQRMSA